MPEPGSVKWLFVNAGAIRNNRNAGAAKRVPVLAVVAGELRLTGFQAQIYGPSILSYDEDHRRHPKNVPDVAIRTTATVLLDGHVIE